MDRSALIFAVDSVDRVCDELRDKGVSLETEPQDRPVWGVRTAHFRDPDGNLIEINTELQS
jgi:catechol 2,3-dioxygenase-like lactoylglutathione lyase family enzyme